MVRVVTRKRLAEPDCDQAYWLSRSPEERIEALATLRRECEGWSLGNDPSLPRVVSMRRMG